MKKTILYIGWVGFNNLGDDVCSDIFVRNISLNASERGIDLDIKTLFPVNFGEFALARLKPDLVVLGAGSLFEPVYLKPLVLAQQNLIPTVIWGSGYDSMLPSPIDANSIDRDSAYMIRQVVQNAKLIGVRGPYTLELLEAVGANNPNLHVAGDPGLLLNRQKETIKLYEIENGQKPIIAVNWGTASNKVLGQDEKGMARDLAAVLTQLTNDYKLVIYPVWEKDIAICRDLYSLIGHSDLVTLLERVPTADELVELYRKSSFSINMKLHANIFSAACDCPFVCLAYRMKSYDFATSMDWTDLTILFSDENRETKIHSAILKLTKDSQRYTQHLRQGKLKYKARLSALEHDIIALL